MFKDVIHSTRRRRRRRRYAMAGRGDEECGNEKELKIKKVNLLQEILSIFCKYQQSFLHKNTDAHIPGPEMPRDEGLMGN